ncbi:hypothetical protein [Aestuariivirga sp.]|uniref:hypothetical protein n=1 Tax=Aestuariivirga sp. TaxID=2650926 RepID=UPI00301747CF
MPLLTRNRVALLLALPAFLVPVIEIPLVLWARSTFISLHPDYFDDPPTISRSINDPVVGAPFANLILVITALILAIVPILILSYLLAISRLTLRPWQRILMYGLLLLVLVLQLAASAGMVMTTQFTFAIDRDMHMLGSYVFFIFQALSILAAGTLCRLLLSQQRKHGIADHDWPFRSAMHRFRFRFAMLIVGLVVLYGVLFVLKDHALPISAYVVRVAYTQCEVLVIACYVLFLGSYAVDIHDMVRRDKLRLPVSAAATKALTTAEGPAAASGAAVTER